MAMVEVRWKEIRVMPSKTAPGKTDLEIDTVGGRTFRLFGVYPKAIEDKWGSEPLKLDMTFSCDSAPEQTKDAELK
jgi:hypothetical protein